MKHFLTFYSYKTIRKLSIYKAYIDITYASYRISYCISFLPYMCLFSVYIYIYIYIYI